jgi:phosphatidylglycerophosphatase A
MMKVNQLLSSVFGIGYIGKGGGTIAAIGYCTIWWLLPPSFTEGNLQIWITLVIIFLGTFSAGKVDKIWGKDSSKVVIDEVAGMAISLLFVPQHPGYLATGLVAFRFFDIVKPLGIRKAEALPRGWGVMADDVLAGIYALAVVQTAVLIVTKFG